jgi:GT2 family glycosyltransferase
MQGDVSAPPLVIIPCDPRTPEALDVTARCLVAVWQTARQQAEVVVVMDGESDAAVAGQVHAAAEELGFGFGLTAVRTSLAAGVNPALDEALAEGRDAVIAGPDIEPTDGWLDALLNRRDTSDEGPAAVVGGRTVFTNGLIDHAGLQFSLLRHAFVPSTRFAPASLREARVPRLCPVGAGLVLIRHGALAELGGLAEDLPGQELVDYSLRAFGAGLECVYEPAAYAISHAPIWEPAPTDAEKVVRLALEKEILVRHEGRLARWAAPVKS